MNIIEASSSRRQKFKNERLEEMMEAIFKGTQKMNEGETIVLYLRGTYEKGILFSRGIKQGSLLRKFVLLSLPLVLRS